MKTLYFDKTCTKCFRSQPNTEYYKDKSKKDGHCSSCKSCLYIYSQTTERKAAVNRQSKRWRKNNPEKSAQSVTNANLRYKYGISLDEYDVMYKTCKGLCEICNKEEGAGKRLAVDHCHETGEVRGLLCFACNTSLGKFNDSISTLEKAIKYLKRYE